MRGINSTTNFLDQVYKMGIRLFQEGQIPEGQERPVPPECTKTRVEFIVMLDEDGIFKGIRRNTEKTLVRNKPRDAVYVIPQSPYAVGRTVNASFLGLVDKAKYFADTRFRLKEDEKEGEKDTKCVSVTIPFLEKWLEYEEIPEIRAMYNYITASSFPADAEAYNLAVEKKASDYLKWESYIGFEVSGKETWKDDALMKAWKCFCADVLYPEQEETLPKGRCMFSGKYGPLCTKSAIGFGGNRIICGNQPMHFVGLNGVSERYQLVPISTDADRIISKTLQYLMELNGVYAAQDGVFRDLYDDAYIAWADDGTLLRRPDDAGIIKDAAGVTHQEYRENLSEVLFGEAAQKNEDEDTGYNMVVYNLPDKGRCRIIEYCHMSHNAFAENQVKWYSDVSFIRKKYDKDGMPTVSYFTPSVRSIIQLVMGETEFSSTTNQKSPMRRTAGKIQAELFDEILFGSPIREDFIKRAFINLFRPRQYKNGSSFSAQRWRDRMASFCALYSGYTIRKGLAAPPDRIDRNRINRDYLLGRMAAVLNDLEYSETKRNETRIISAMANLKMRPLHAVLDILKALTPYIERSKYAGMYVRQITSFLSYFSLDDLKNDKEAGYEFFVGFYVQMNRLYPESQTDTDNEEKENNSIVAFDEITKVGISTEYLLGCLLGAAQWFERRCVKDKRKEGNTKAYKHLQEYCLHPSRTWTDIFLTLSHYIKTNRAMGNLFLRVVGVVENRIPDDERYCKKNIGAEAMLGMYHMLSTCRRVQIKDYIPQKTDNSFIPNSDNPEEIAAAMLKCINNLAWHANEGKGKPDTIGLLYNAHAKPSRFATAILRYSEIYNDAEPIDSINKIGLANERDILKELVEKMKECGDKANLNADAVLHNYFK